MQTNFTITKSDIQKNFVRADPVIAYTWLELSQWAWCHVMCYCIGWY